MAYDVDKRMRSLQTSNPEKLELVATREIDLAELLERRIHQQLQMYSLSGGKEWFKLKPERALQVCIQLNSPVIQNDPERSKGYVNFTSPATQLSDIELLEKAKKVFDRHKRGSTSLLQRELRIGYARASRIVSQLELQGFLSPPDGARPRQVLNPDNSEKVSLS